MGRATKDVSEEARQIAFDLQHVRPFAEVVYSHSQLTQRHDSNPLPIIDAGYATEYMLLPLLHNREVLSILYCDNPNSGRPLGNLSGLALFLTQAGMAMENASLHRKVRSFENQFSVDNQGPLTQELTRIAPAPPEASANAPATIEPAEPVKPVKPAIALKEDVS